MKKSVIILIAVIYIASIALVSFFGLKFKAYNEKIYVSDVEITNSGLKTNDNGEKYVVIRPDGNGELKYKIDYTITPENATAQEVEFQYDKEITYVTVADDGTVVFDIEKMGGRGAVQVKVVSTDGTGISDTIMIYAFSK